MILSDALYPRDALPRDVYDQIDRNNFSTLKRMRKSPAHYRHFKAIPPEDTPAKRLGRCSHLAVLEPDLFASSVAVWEGAVRRGKEWEAFQAKHVGKELITVDEHQQCLDIRDAVHRHEVARRYLTGGRSELTALWSIGELRCKGRLDYVNGVGIADLKTTKDASPDGFQLESHRYGYHVQAAWYSDGHRIVSGSVKPYFIAAVESEPPHVVQIYRVPEHILAVGRREYMRWVDRLTFCAAQDWWPGYAEDELDLTLPRWVVPEEITAEVG